MSGPCGDEIGEVTGMKQSRLTDSLGKDKKERLLKTGQSCEKGL